VLNVGHFHVVFTLPSQLRELSLRNPKVVYAALFKAATETLLMLCQTQSKNPYIPGITSVLHTWTRKLTYHPHLHCIVTAGGLSLDGTAWNVCKTKNKYLVAVDVLKKVFRGKMVDALKHAEQAGQLDWGPGPTDPMAMQELTRHLYAVKWHVYAKRPFASCDAVFRYLGRYTHRVGISNQRLVRFEDSQVTFLTKDGKHGTVDHAEFVRRIMLHVLPKGFVKIRHAGLYASGSVKSRLPRAKALLPPQQSSSDQVDAASHPSEAWNRRMHRLTGRDPMLCPHCATPFTITTLARSRWNHHARDPP
jgi:hypothetical protein